MPFSCPFCHAQKSTQSGLRSHISQKTSCRLAFHAHLSNRRQCTGAVADDCVDNELENVLGMNPESIGSLPDPHQSSSKSNDSTGSSEDVAQNKQVRVDKAEDDSEDIAAGIPRDPYVQDHEHAGATYGTGTSSFDKLYESRTAELPWAPFGSQEEWELARWLLTSGLTQGEIDKFLKLDIVSVLVLWCSSS